MTLKEIEQEFKEKIVKHSWVFQDPNGTDKQLEYIQIFYRTSLTSLLEELKMEKKEEVGVWAEQNLNFRVGYNEAVRELNKRINKILK